jgi:protease-4
MQRPTVLCGLICAILFAFCTGCITVDLLDGGGPEAQLVETVVRGDEGPKILLVEIDGVIGSSNDIGSLFGGSQFSMVARVKEVLDLARRDDDVGALLLRIDSPGGTVTASEQIYTEINRYRRESRVPVMAQFLGTATSGGYYIAMAADAIQAHPTTVTGSIGVIFSSISFAGLMEKIGVEDQTITGGAYKNAGSPYRRLSDVERDQFQSIVDDLHTRFREIVVIGRPDLSSDQVATLADGRIFSAQQALANGLVDRIGTLEDAVGVLEQRLGVPESRVVTYHRPREIRRNLYTRATLIPSISGGGGSEFSAEAWALKRLESMLARPGFQYLWWPGLSGSATGH